MRLDQLTSKARHHNRLPVALNISIINNKTRLYFAAARVSILWCHRTAVVVSSPCPIKAPAPAGAAPAVVALQSAATASLPPPLLTRSAIGAQRP